MTQKTHIIKCFVTKTQREKIENDAQAKGYVFISAYLRDLLLNKGNFIEEKIMETNQQIKKLLEAIG
ncbi:MAG: hypothetical protein KKH52_00730 [Nanoarchaeota archaeon]|nr:hypothetical protein [Nanoarchaeota archaeon]MBU1622259.1 hypothetical protein [Nanoarchaeota archaeon]MBU1973901.1 hypothetical protein [Nanoarchaeota archaeon]